MENENAKHEKDYIKAYQEKGYTANFRFEEGKLIASDSKTSYSPDDVHIVADHRYEGMSNPSDMSILYVLETNDGKKEPIYWDMGLMRIWMQPNSLRPFPMRMFPIRQALILDFSI